MKFGEVERLTFTGSDVVFCPSKLQQQCDDNPHPILQTGSEASQF